MRFDNKDIIEKSLYDVIINAQSVADFFSLKNITAECFILSLIHEDQQRKYLIGISDLNIEKIDKEMIGSIKENIKDYGFEYDRNLKLKFDSYEDYYSVNNILPFHSDIFEIINGILEKKKTVNVQDFCSALITNHKINKIINSKDLTLSVVNINYNIDDLHKDHKESSYKNVESEGKVDVEKKPNEDEECMKSMSDYYEEENSDDEILGTVLINMNEEIKEQIKNGFFVPVIGRDKEIDEVIRILSRKDKNNPIIVGKSGVGKTSIVKGLVYRILSKDVPTSFKDKEIYLVNVSEISANAKYRGDIEKKMNKIMLFKKKNPNAIFFIDEIQSIFIKDQMSGKNPIGGYLKSKFENNSISCIGTITFDDYMQYIEKERSMERRFMKVTINELSEVETISILKVIKQSYEKYHNVKIEDNAIVASVLLSSRYMKDKQLPDKAIDIIDLSASRLKFKVESKPENISILEREISILNGQLKYIDKNSAEHGECITKIQQAEKRLNDISNKNKESVIRNLKVSEIKEKIKEIDYQIIILEKNAEYEKAAKLRYSDKIELEKELENVGINDKNIDSNVVSKDNIEETVSILTGIPISKLEEGEMKKLLSLEDKLAERVIGQSNATKIISDVIRMSKTGVSEEGKPVGSFLFLGPTGVGKTEITKALSDIIFGSEKDIIRFDMSEFAESHSVAKLIGAPPGYAGYDKGGELTEAVKRKPYSIVLFDEVEKAHEKFADILLQVLDDGRLTDSFGDTVDFSHSIIILTSNIGSEYIIDNIEKSRTNKKEFDDCIMENLKDHFRPEFINRLNDIIVFEPLTEDVIYDIAKIQLSNLKKRLLKNKNIRISWDENVITEISKLGFDRKFGARPLKRAVSNFIQKKLSYYILENNIIGDRDLTIQYENDEFKVI